MPWGVAAAAVGAAGSIAGASMGANAQNKASNAALGEQQREYDTTRNDNASSLAARNTSLANMQDMQNQWGTSGPSAADVMNTPGYQFGMTQGSNALQGSAAAGGGLYSGATMKALEQYGNDYGTTKFDDAFNRLQTGRDSAFNRQAAIGGLGQVGSTQIGQAGMNAANNSSAIDMATGRNNAGYAVAGANGVAGALNGGMSTFRNSPGGWWGGSSGNGDFSGMPQGYDTETGSTYKPSDNYGFARGGPVRYADGGRVEPVIGSKSPVRTSGAGPMSTNALMQALQPAQPASGPGIGQLPANYLMNPQAILAARMQQAGYESGGPVIGPGGPKTDSIPARLSNGEHVMDAATVNAIGGGDNDAGQMKLNKLRAMLKRTA